MVQKLADHNRRLLGQEVAFQATLEVGNLVAADADTDNLDTELLVLFGQFLPD